MQQRPPPSARIMSHVTTGHCQDQETVLEQYKNSFRSYMCSISFCLHSWPMLLLNTFQNLFLYFLCVWLFRVLVAACGILIMVGRIFSGGVRDSQLRVPSCGVWDLAPLPGTEPGPLHWECGVLATGPPGKSLKCFSMSLHLLQAPFPSPYLY